MTEKRYKMVNTNLVDDDGLVYYLIKKDGRDVCQVFGKHTAKVIVTELNALHDENEQLKDALNQRTDQCDKYYKENEKLKQDKTNLHRAMSRNRVRYNQFRDKVFCCIDKKIDEFKNGNYGDLPCNTIHMFLDLKQEIGDDLND